MLQSPEIQTMYSLNIPVSAIRTKIRQEFEKHRYVSQLKVVDVLLFQSHAEFQVRSPSESSNGSVYSGGGILPGIMIPEHTPLHLFPFLSGPRCADLLLL